MSPHGDIIKVARQRKCTVSGVQAESRYFTLRVESRTISSGTILR